MSEGILTDLLFRYEEWDADIRAESARLRTLAETAKAEAEKYRKKAERNQKYAEKYLNLARSLNYPDWKVAVLDKLAEAMGKKLGLHYTVQGPAGLGSRCFIILYADKDQKPTEQPHKELIVQPTFLDGKLYFCYETGVVIERYEKGTVGYQHGFNNEVANLPDDLDEIISLLKDREPLSFRGLGGGTKKADNQFSNGNKTKSSEEDSQEI